MNIDWLSKESHCFLNARLPEGLQKNILKCFASLEDKNFLGHIFLATSGTTALSPQSIKFVALSKQAFLQSSQAVNQHFHSTSQDCWLNVLPHFHVGGLSIFSRAYLSGARVVNLYNETYKWDANIFIDTAESARATICSLVPTQLYDLIQLNLKAPKSFKAIIVGGGRLENALFKKATSLGWPVFPSYGLTEACSQVATHNFKEDFETTNVGLTILPHIILKVDDKNNILVKGNSLFTCHFFYNEGLLNYIDPKDKEGFYCTGDIGEVKKEKLFIYSRQDSVVKIGGENVNIAKLESIFNDIKFNNNMLSECVLLPYEDIRLQNIITVVFENSFKENKTQIENLVETYNANVLPYEKIRHVFFIDSIPKTALGKIM
ncbi:MAG: AMP-binding protein, partial [Silvanigrellaceae bacterium]|nr:AMP-binding protein [Silvanigrellaceae bacterium]